jgi:hypothetical protein
MPHIDVFYVAVKPIKAEHPVGSGTVVDYQPGDVIPAGEWGRAADNLVELGKAARMAINVPDDNEDLSALGQLRGAAVPAGHGLSDPTHAYLALEGVDTGTIGPAEDEEAEPEAEPDEAEAEEEDQSDMSHSYPEHTGGGWYTLSDGSRVRGEENAVAAEAALGG